MYTLSMQLANNDTAIIRWPRKSQSHGPQAV